ncbi:MAG: cyanophycin synthetase [Candidatus Paceibacterota bacterium]
MNINLSQIKKVFFIGIGGIGISALAKMVSSRGIISFGINDEETGKTLDTLKEEGIEVVYLKDYKEIPEADMYVYSDAWIYRGPEILESAKNTGKPVLSFFEALGEFAKQYKVIAISGTHGKTTTTAMTANVLIDAGLDPTVIVGSFVSSFGSNFRKGNSEYLVVEADEYNRHMLNFHPYIGAITNMEADHLDCYKDLADIKQAFDQFLSQSEIKITETEYQKYIVEVPPLKVPGEHNRKNAAVVLAIIETLGIPLDQAQKSLAQFTGTWRRLEKKGITKEGVIVYDDYAHHPTEVRASLQALKELYPNSRIVVVFQPHLYSRTKALFNDFINCFDQADFVYLLPIYFAREAKDPSISSTLLAHEISKHKGEVYGFESFSDTLEALKSKFQVISLEKGDIFVTMGAGEAYKIADDLLDLQ